MTYTQQPAAPFMRSAPLTKIPPPHDFIPSPPQSPEAERAVLGACLMEREAVAAVLPLLKAEYFVNRINAAIYGAIVACFENPALSYDGVFTVATHLRNGGMSDLDFGTTDYLVELIASCASSKMAEAYAKEVRDKATERDLLSAAEETKTDVHFSGKTTAEKTEAAGARFAAIGQERTQAKFHSISDLADQAMERLRSAYQNGMPSAGIGTGFTALDELVGGFREGELIIVGARPSMGKSALMSQIAKNVASMDAGPVYIASLEMSKEQLTERMLCEMAGVNSRDLNQLTLSDPELLEIDRAYERFRHLNLFIEDTPNASTHHVHAMARSIASEHGALAMVLVDYAQRMTYEAASMNRVQQVGMIAQSLKTLARQQNCPVVALSQLSRGIESREDKRPLLSDLRESGDLEAEADKVLGLYRDSYYRKREGETLAPLEIDTAELIVLKNRSGATGTAKLGWRAEYTRFFDVAQEQPSNYEPKAWRGNS